MSSTVPAVRTTVLLLTVAVLVATAPAASAQSISLHADAPPEPIAPEVITRDGEGHATVRAVRLSQPLRIDGALDEAPYRDVRSISDFVQVESAGGEAATERTEISRCRSTSADGSPAAPAGTALVSSISRPATRRGSSAHPQPTSP
jgi:hypothetical protein